MAKKKRQVDEVRVMRAASKLKNTKLKECFRKVLARQFRTSLKCINKIIGKWTPQVRIAVTSFESAHKAPALNKHIDSPAIDKSLPFDSPVLFAKKPTRPLRTLKTYDDCSGQPSPPQNSDSDPYKYTYIDSPPIEQLNESFSLDSPVLVAKKPARPLRKSEQYDDCSEQPSPFVHTFNFDRTPLKEERLNESNSIDSPVFTAKKHDRPKRIDDLKILSTQRNWYEMKFISGWVDRLYFYFTNTGTQSKIPFSLTKIKTCYSDDSEVQCSKIDSPNDLKIYDDRSEYFSLDGTFTYNTYYVIP